MSAYRFWADLLVVAHAAWAGFIVIGLVVILVGARRSWNWTRNFWFRAVHLAMIAIVVGESLMGIPCPLTVWENQLRQLAGEATYPGSFIGYWVHELLFFDFPEWFMTLIYCLFGGAVLATLWLSPPRWPRRSGRAPS